MTEHFTLKTIAGNLRAEMARQGLTPFMLMRKIKSVKDIDAASLSTTLIQQCCDEDWMPGLNGVRAMSAGLEIPESWLAMDQREFWGHAERDYRDLDSFVRDNYKGGRPTKVGTREHEEKFAQSRVAEVEMDIDLNASGPIKLGNIDSDRKFVPKALSATDCV
jgi:hypothetical protein